ncbi:hypothetical protein F4811DRAFT_574419 [Daldinia bambusicola]|nr:hypothetical protein F4811DRAFT_574419 [Daldinia bambusicola]
MALLQLPFKSVPRKQFDDSVVTEVERILHAARKEAVQAEQEGRQPGPGPDGEQVYDQAVGEVRRQWIQQGIWQAKWDTTMGKPNVTARWTHEGKLPEGITPEEAAAHPSDDIPVEKSVVLSEFNASRPVKQYFAQVALERERVEAEYGVCPPGLAEDVVRARWVTRGIWADDWCEIPGETWMHDDKDRPLLDRATLIEQRDAEVDSLTRILSDRLRELTETDADKVPSDQAPSDE